VNCFNFTSVVGYNQHQVRYFLVCGLEVAVEEEKLVIISEIFSLFAFSMIAGEMFQTSRL
jgi:hypothetical protein